jgi:hypothetical protein
MEKGKNKRVIRRIIMIKIVKKIKEIEKIMYNKIKIKKIEEGE